MKYSFLLSVFSSQLVTDTLCLSIKTLDLIVLTYQLICGIVKVERGLRPIPYVKHFTISITPTAIVIIADIM